MDTRFDYLFDKQQAPVLGYCEICGGELYREEEGTVCCGCRDDLRIHRKLRELGDRSVEDE